MRHFPSSISRAAFAALIISLPVFDFAAQGETAFSHAQLKIETANGPVLFDVEVADNDRRREHGLMFRRELSGKHGMIFLFGEEHEITMWMKNTYISLDMVFIGDDWRIVNIARDAEPLSTEVISSVRPASKVLEIPGGEAAKLGLRPGDAVSLEQ
jgi:uncharacterized protein